MTSVIGSVGAKTLYQVLHNGLGSYIAGAAGLSGAALIKHISRPATASSNPFSPGGGGSGSIVSDNLDLRLPKRPRDPTELETLKQKKRKTSFRRYPGRAWRRKWRRGSRYQKRNIPFGGR
ncbi:hypothetical protein [robinz virus RP_340]|nr:hypothetical protein [robinz virus RP_340]